MKKRDLERRLFEHGCRLARQGSRHELWENKAGGQRTTVPRHKQIKLQPARSICRQLGVPAPPGSR